MSRFKDFDAARAESRGEALTFKLGGEQFTAAGELPAGIILDLGRSVANGDDLASFGLFTEFFEAIVAPEDQERFAVAVRHVGLSTVLELVQWIVEEQTARPLTSASSSPPVQWRSGASSNGDSEMQVAPSP